MAIRMTPVPVIPPLMNPKDAPAASSAAGENRSCARLTAAIEKVVALR
jgi:hypothetical protein